MGSVTEAPFLQPLQQVEQQIFLKSWAGVTQMYGAEGSLIMTNCFQKYLLMPRSSCGVIFDMEKVAGAGILGPDNKLQRSFLILFLLVLSQGLEANMVFPLGVQESLVLGLLQEGEGFHQLSKQ
ncbi:hypothetical protein AOLI_G00314940 [Acnodon oligacanthus]